jgi:hypothetical protein
MEADRWSEVKRIANACLTLPPEQRSSSFIVFAVKMQISPPRSKA